MLRSLVGSEMCIRDSSHRNDVSPLTQGLRYRAACDDYPISQLSRSNHRHIDTTAKQFRQTISIYTTHLLSNTVLLLLLSSISRGIEPQSVHSASVAANVGRSTAATTARLDQDLRCQLPQRPPGQSSQLLPSASTRLRLSSTLPTSSVDDETLESNTSVPGYRGYTSFARWRRGERYTTVGGHFETIRQ